MAHGKDEEFNVYFENQMYNIKRFMKNHPGGTNTLKNKEMKDITYMMKTHDHSEYAYYMLEQYKSQKSSTINGIKTNTNGSIINGMNGIKNGIKHVKNGDANHNEIDNNNQYETNEEQRKKVQRMIEIENLVDWSQPILGQIHKLGSNYYEWVHNPVDKKLRLFEYSFLEIFTFTAWYMVPIFWLPILTYCTYYTYTNQVLCGSRCNRPYLSHFGYLFRFAMGILLWTFLEYSIHRWIFHYKPGKRVIWKQLHFLIHGLHHKVPFDELRLVFPPIPGLVLFLFIYTVFKIFIIHDCEVIAIGGTTGYLTYDMIHYFIHNSSPKDGSYLYIMKRYHATHHFKEPFLGYGISNKLWDYILDTMIQMKKLDIKLSWD